MVLEKGEKIHIVERRFFSDDIRRHFCGEVVHVSEPLVRAKGYVWVLNIATNEFIKKPGQRERVFCLSDRLTVNIIPKDVEIEKVNYSYNDKEGHFLSDGQSFSLNVAEFGVIS